MSMKRAIFGFTGSKNRQEMACAESLTAMLPIVDAVLDKLEAAQIDGGDMEAIVQAEFAAAKLPTGSLEELEEELSFADGRNAKKRAV